MVTSHLDIAPWSTAGYIVPVEDYVDLDAWPLNNVYPNLITALAMVKKACALANLDCGALDEDIANAIAATQCAVWAGFRDKNNNISRYLSGENGFVVGRFS